MTALAGGVIALVLLLAADGSIQGHPPWRTWIACCTLIALLGALAATGIVVGRLLS